MAYLLNTDEQVKEMLDTLGLKTLEELYDYLPKELIIDELNIPEALGEIDVLRSFQNLSAKNKVFSSIFRGAGSYRHYIPAVVPEMANKERFKTAYTPYQAEVSQGTLQSIFEFQTMICELTGMDVANASVYDGASAAAEAVSMCRDRKKKRAYISGGVNPRVINTVKTYSWSFNAPVEILEQTKDGLVDIDALEKTEHTDIAALLIEQPNYYGLFEDVSKIVEVAHKKGIKVIVKVNPIAAAVVESVGECGADIAVGEGQPLGIPLGFGGPYLGFMACKKNLLRAIPGRIVGETKDEEGNRAYVLTLQAREQHIRRETAGSNLCSNQALCAITASVYMSSMGPKGMEDVAMQCYNKAHYLANELGKIGFKLRYNSEFFHEFVTESPCDIEKLNRYLENNNILGGLPIENNGILWCATEMNTKHDIDNLVSLCKEVL
ncbi:MAG: aminomethyl-transferring glycine dehydrogenase subunit GcvPA [Defluviitaleaceae bacterium]|nr:aminomethyl-transferring glycine dehydrogenase subunit GcvPA [Defluviitaleaceae bacterium]